MAESIVRQKSYDFALQILRLCICLREQKHFEISSQLLRAGTSVGANVEEALAGQSRKDFAAKMCVASKEARESNYWLRLLIDAGILTGRQAKEMIEASDELVKMLTSILRTTYENETAKLGTQNSKLKTQN